MLALASSSVMGQISVAADFALPNWEGVSLGYGVSAGYELDLGDNLGATAQIGYLIMGIDGEFDDFIKSYSMIPIQVGAKYYLDSKTSGLYGHVQLGVHSVSVTTPEIIIPAIPGFSDEIVFPEETITDSQTSFAVGAGYIINESLDVALRYNVLTSEAGSDGYIGIRVGYTIGGQ